MTVTDFRHLLVLLLALALPVSGWAADAADDAKNDDLSLEMIATEQEDAFLFEDEELLEVWDPIEPVNRAFFWFNDKLYFYLLKPVARGYRKVPEPWRISVKNFFSNLTAPVRIINAGLQGKFGDAGNEMTRFVVNTTIGIGGFFDTAKDHFNLQMKDEDTGQTLGFYGVGPGPYIVIPVLGPSNLRDGLGDFFVDRRLNLLYYMTEGWTYYGLRAYDKVNDLSLDKDTYEGIKRDALDPYLFVRDAFMQYRQNKIDN